ncbi:diacylglycerol kinase family protein [Longimicrobium sp.]|uniref:diacylglycerol/lipid kinase family protein n=1 Tax=Longimicrobium sp. TaxID=2029185 RepID=UPI002B6B7991|nr:diacylglycerol kinase family protein [Longimicrobium sp.]HSU12925.1 diacylglycerol kinase family protein [Longimicrobium sp.]
MDHPLATLDPPVLRGDAPEPAYAGRNLIVLNPVAGQADTDRVLRLLAGAFAVRRSPFDVVETRGAGDAVRFAREAAEQGYRSVVAVGGDGTVGEVITGLAGTGVPLGIIPKGTGNQVAFNLGIPRSVEHAVDVVVNGRTEPMDLGQVAEGRYFAVAAGTGVDAEIVALATRELKDRWGFGAYIYAILKVASAPPAARYRISADGQELELDASMVLVANMGMVVTNPQTLRFRLAPEGTHRDGRLDLCIFAPRTATHAAQMLWRMYRQRFGGDERMIFLQARDITIETEPTVLTEADGEPLGQTPLRARAVPGGINVLVPR